MNPRFLLDVDGEITREQIIMRYVKTTLSSNSPGFIGN